MGCKIAVYDFTLPRESDPQEGNLPRCKQRKRGQRSRRGGKRRALVSADSAPPWEGYFGGEVAWRQRNAIPLIPLESWNSDLRWTPRRARALLAEGEQVESYIQGPPPAYSPGVMFSRKDRLNLRFSRFVKRRAASILKGRSRLWSMRERVAAIGFDRIDHPMVRTYRSIRDGTRATSEDTARIISERSGTSFEASLITLNSFVDDLSGRDVYFDLFGVHSNPRHPGFVPLDWENLQYDLLREANSVLANPLELPSYDSRGLPSFSEAPPPPPRLSFAQAREERLRQRALQRGQRGRRSRGRGGRSSGRSSRG